MSASRVALWLCAVWLVAVGAPAQSPLRPAADKTPTAVSPAEARRQSGRSPGSGEPGSNCPAGYLCGQNALGTIWLYSDFGASTPQPGNPGVTWSRRVTSEQFPPPGAAPLAAPIGLITWHGAYIDDNSNGCTKAHHFRIEFYSDDGTGKPVCTQPVYSWSGVPDAARIMDTVDLGGAVPADEYEFQVALPSPVGLPSGHFSITSDNIVPNCYHVLAPSGTPEGNGLTWRWYEQPRPCNIYPVGGSTIDIEYCFSQVTPGACCDDCVGGAAACEDSNDFLCGLQGGRFEPNVSCAALDPPCGQAAGACCRDDGSCEMTACAQCVPATQACCLPDHSCRDVVPNECLQRAGTPRGPGTACATTACDYCLGDLNCDGVIDFGDINPFVLYLSDCSAWQAAYPGCNPKNGDVGCDGTYCVNPADFADINPYVLLLSSTRPIPCPVVCQPPPAPRDQGPYWGGVGSTCDPNAPTAGCCTVTVPPAADQEGEISDCTTDHYDGGCNASPPVFKTIGALPITIYGQSGTFDGLRDTDWYEYISTTPLALTVTLRAEFDATLSILHAGTPDLCGDSWLITEPATGGKCMDVRLVTRCLPAGRYWFAVNPNSFGGVRCGADYRLTVESADCEPCTITCAPGDQSESPCNDDPKHADDNAGCNGDPNDPNQFAPVSYTPGTPVVLCGTVWARGGYRDHDWYSLALTQRTSVVWQVDTAAPVRASLLFSYPGDGTHGPPTCANRFFWSQTLFAPCVHAAWNHPEIIYEPGTYWFLVEPEDANGPVINGYACESDSVYRIELVVGPRPGERSSAIIRSWRPSSGNRLQPSPSAARQD